MMRMLRITSAIIGGALLALLMVNAAVASTTVSVQLKNQNQVMSSATVVLYLSYGSEQGTTNADGRVSIPVGRGQGVWIEINGQRLNHFYQLGQIPAVIDIAQVGTMTWRGGK